MLDVLDPPSIRLAEEAERHRIARAFHDGVVQSLTALVADLEYFQTRCLLTLDQTSPEVAEKVTIWQELALDGLRQQAELDFGLEYAMQVVLNGLREAGYTVVYECDSWPTQIPMEYTSNMYYIIREA